MQSKDIWSTTVKISAAGKSGTGVLVAACADEFDYVITALHNIVGADKSSIAIFAGAKQLELKEINIGSDSKIDIAILHVEKSDLARRIPFCDEERNLAPAISFGYPGALQGKMNEATDYSGEISHIGDETTLHFNIRGYPDPDIDKQDYITGFSGAGVFELSDCKQYAKLKAIVVQRWDENFDIKKVKCIKILAVTKILDELGAPKIADLIDDFSCFLLEHNEGLDKGIVQFVQASPHVQKIATLDRERILSTPLVLDPTSDRPFSKVRNAFSGAQLKFFADLFCAKSISFIYYHDSLEELDLYANPLALENQLKIVLCCATERIEAPLLLCQLARRDYREYLSNSIVIVCYLNATGFVDELFGFEADLTSKIISDYVNFGSQLDRASVRDIKNYLEMDEPESRFSIYSVASIRYEIKKALGKLFYIDKNNYYNDSTFIKTLRETLDGTVKRSDK